MSSRQTAATLLGRSSGSTSCAGTDRAVRGDLPAQEQPKLTRAPDGGVRLATNALRRRLTELREPALQQPSLGLVVCELQSARELFSGLVEASQALEQLPARRVQIPIVPELQPIDDRETRLRP